MFARLKNFFDWSVWLGIIGMFFPIIGNLIPPSSTRALCFVIGSILMLFAAAKKKHAFFIALQLIVLVGSVLYFAPFPKTMKMLIPLLTSGLFIIYFALSGRFSKPINWVGTVGVIFLSIGYSLGNPWGYLFGGIFLTVFAFFDFMQGTGIALLWFLLNAFFTVATVYNILKF